MPVWGQGPGKIGWSSQPAIDGVVFEPAQVEHGVDQHGVQPPGVAARVGHHPRGLGAAAGGREGPVPGATSG